MKKTLLTLAALAFIGFAGTGCHTVQGAGEDIKTAGEKGQQTIDPEGQKR